MHRHLPQNPEQEPQFEKQLDHIYGDPLINLKVAAGEAGTSWDSLQEQKSLWAPFWHSPSNLKAPLGMPFTHQP